MCEYLDRLTVLTESRPGSANLHTKAVSRSEVSACEKIKNRTFKENIQFYTKKS